MANHYCWPVYLTAMIPVKRTHPLASVVPAKVLPYMSVIGLPEISRTLTLILNNIMKKHFNPKPERWISGPDPERHKRYLQWLQQKNQAQFRGEEWNLDFDDWLQVWGDEIVNRGRKKGQLSMMRRDYNLPWTADNVLIVGRKEHSAIQQLIVRQRKGQENYEE